jgi:hypothetical protein
MIHYTKSPIGVMISFWEWYPSMDEGNWLYFFIHSQISYGPFVGYTYTDEVIEFKGIHKNIIQFNFTKNTWETVEKNRSLGLKNLRYNMQLDAYYDSEQPIFFA